MSREHITSHAMHLWDMRMIELMRAGRSKEIIEIMPEFTEQAIAETDGGALTWLIAALDFPTEPAILHGYGTVIGTRSDRGVAHLNGDDRMNRVVRTLITPAHPHPLLAPDRNPGWGRVRDAYEQAGAEIRASGADLIILYSTLWPSIIGHQIQADPNPVWNLVDPDFHALGTIDYDLRIDAEFAHAWDAANTARGLTSRTVAYHGFPIDVGSVVALKLLDPEGRIPAVICSSNVYSDRAETTVLAKACRDALEQTGRTAAVVGVMSLSNRMFTTTIDPAEDRIHSLKDDEWNRKISISSARSRLEDVAQLSRTIHDQIRVKKVVSFKPMWWLSSMNGEHNRFKGDVLAYEPIHGAGAAVVVLTPSADASGDKEYDEDGVETFTGDRGVLDSIASNPSETDLLVHRPEDPGIATWDPTDHGVSINATEAPRPVGPYPHARRVGDMIYLSGVGPPSG